MDATLTPTEQERLNWYRFTRILLDVVYPLLRRLFRQRFAAKYGLAWTDDGALDVCIHNIIAADGGKILSLAAHTCELEVDIVTTSEQLSSPSSSSSSYWSSSSSSLSSSSPSVAILAQTLL